VRRVRAAGTLAAALVALGLVGSSTALANQFAYEPDFSTGLGVAGFSVSANGALTAVPGSPFATGGDNLEGLVIAPDGKHLYTVADGGTSRIYSFAIGANGVLTPVGTPQPISSSAVGVAITPNQKFVFVANRSATTISTFAVNTDGSLTQLMTSPSGTVSAPSGFAVSPDSRFLYVAHSSAAGKVSAYAITANGTLSALPGSPYSTGTVPYTLNLTPNGKYLYVAARPPDNKVFGYSVNADGTITPLAGTPPATGANPFGMTITPDSSRLYTTNYDDGSISGFSIAADGTLMSTGTTPSASSPADATTNAAGTRLYVAKGSATQIEVFDGATSGLLAPITGSPFASGIEGDFESIALTPDQPPVASFKVRSGKHAHFDASASADPDGGTIARYDWNFGDGTTLLNGGSKPTHNYPKGNFTARLTVTDDQGCSTSYISAGETAFCNGSGVATTTQNIDATPPTLKLSGKKKQTLGKPVTIKAMCDERCGVRAGGSIKIRGEGKFKLTQKSKELNADAARQLKLKLPKKARNAAKEASKGKATVEATATDDANNKTTKKFKVKLRD